jgi:hypothetical protein
MSRRKSWVPRRLAIASAFLIALLAVPVVTWLQSLRLSEEPPRPPSEQNELSSIPDHPQDEHWEDPRDRGDRSTAGSALGGAERQMATDVGERVQSSSDVSESQIDRETSPPKVIFNAAYPSDGAIARIAGRISKDNCTLVVLGTWQAQVIVSNRKFEIYVRNETQGGTLSVQVTDRDGNQTVQSQSLDGCPDPPKWAGSQPEGSVEYVLRQGTEGSRRLGMALQIIRSVRSLPSGVFCRESL